MARSRYCLMRLALMNLNFLMRQALTMPELEAATDRRLLGEIADGL